jgi:hypothetical protein
MSEQSQAAPEAAPAGTQEAKAPEQDLSPEELASLAGEESSADGQDAKAQVEAAQKKVDEAKSKADKEEAKKELAKAKHKYKLKVDGKEEEWEGTDEDIQRELQLAKKARKEIQTSSELKKELAQFLQMLKTDPRSVLADPSIGVDLKAFAQQIINEQIEEELKSPEQREKEKLERELEELRKFHKEQEEARRTDEYNRLVQKTEQELEEQVASALETSGLPKTPYILKRMSDVMLSGLENDKEVSPKQALAIVRREMHKDLKDMFSVSPEDLIEELIGSDNIKRLNKRQLAKIKAAVPSLSSIKDTGAKPKEEKQPEAKKVKISDWLKGKG